MYLFLKKYHIQAQNDLYLIISLELVFKFSFLYSFDSRIIQNIRNLTT